MSISRFVGARSRATLSVLLLALAVSRPAGAAQPEVKSQPAAAPTAEPPTPAAADDGLEGAANVSAAALARAKAIEAERLYERKEFSAALQRLEEAHAVVPSPKLQYNFALVHRALGNDTRALLAFERFLNEAPDADPVRRKAAAKHAAELRQNLVSLEITADVDGAEILVDGQISGRTPQQHGIWVAPGPHLVVVKQTGAAFGFTERIASEAGTSVRIAARLAPIMAALDPNLEAPAPAAKPGSLPQARRETAVTVATSPAPPNWGRRTAWIFTGAAVLGLGVAVYGEMAHRDAIDKFNARIVPSGGMNGSVARPQCSDGLAQRGGPACQIHYDEARRARNLSVGALVATGALATTAIVAFFLSSPGPADSAHANQSTGKIRRPRLQAPVLALAPGQVATSWTMGF